MAATLRVILGQDNTSKLTLPTGIPASLEELQGDIQRHFGLTEQVRWQYRDIEFDNEFMNLTCTSEIRDKSTVKVIYLPNSSGTDTDPHHTASLRALESVADTEILSSPESAASGSFLRSQPWPNIFPIPQFNYEVEVQLEMASHVFHNSGTLLSPSTKLKSDILDGLASEMIKFKVYPSSADFDDVALALKKQHSCLTEQGSVSGYYGWKISLKYKMANYRTRLRNIGCTELSINAMKEKRGKSQGPNQVKKPRKAEVNYCPDYPVGETKDSLEEERQALLIEVKKKNSQLIKTKMEKNLFL
ncbi:hypothetical protein KUCAC02_015797 [Chaenocephalus aceratus]|uniref:Uncharacterized protein n=1 Tax=Chaenocephalus aceratus TaxID=36190 RepID=A0ACB9XZV2_CHAAC|nr:hypothetical protein KUCAC02_015797 [Chaenocephalus aceratus]